MSTAKALFVVIALGTAVGACGDDGPGEASDPPGTPEHPRVVEIEMIDIGYEPSDVEVQVGETVEFVFVNHGAVRHEAVFGDEDVQEDHEREMQQMGDMAMDHDDEPMEPDDEPMAMEHGDEPMDHDEDTAMDHDDGVVALAVEPGASERVVMSFDDPGHVLIGCHESGHWAAGMRVDVDIA